MEKKFNCEIDLRIRTYNTKYSNDLISWYQKQLSAVEFTALNDIPEIVIPKGKKKDDGTGHYNLHFKTEIRNALKTDTKYEFIFVSRIDLLFKEKLFEVFDANWKTIHFPMAWHWRKNKPIGELKCNFKYPVIVDTMMFIPKKYFHVIFEFQLNCKCWNSLLCNENLNINYNDMDFMINTAHQPNTSRQWNPLFRMMGRTEKSEKLYKWNFFDKNNQPV